MTNTETFEPTPPPGTSPVSTSTAPRPRKEKATKKREPKVPKNLHAVTDAEIKAGAKKARKKRVAKAEKAAPETIKVTMKEYASMRVGDNAKLFLKVHKMLAGESKSARAAVLAELSKVLG